jgi:O-antigen/teichoic acid export membrane protein
MGASILIAHLGADSKGVYSFVLLFFSYCIPLFSFGVHGGMKFLISNSSYSISSVILSVLVFSSLLGVFIGAIFLLLWNFDLMGETGQKLQLLHVIVLALLCIPYILSISLNKLLEGAGMFVLRNRIFLFHIIALLASIVYFVWYKKGDVYVALFVFAANHLLNATILLFFVSKSYGFSKMWNSKFIREASSYGIKVWPTEQLGRNNSKIDQLILGFMYPVSFLGVYSVAYAYCDLISLFSLALLPIYFNKIANEKSQEKNVLLTSRIIRILVFFHVVISLIMVAVGYFLVPLVYGNEYRGAADITWIIIPCFLFYNFARVIVYFFSAKGLPLVGSKIQVIGRVAAIPFFLVFIYFYDATGAAIANTIGSILMAILAWYYYRKEVKQTPTEHFIIQLEDWGLLRKLLKRN